MGYARSLEILRTSARAIIGTASDEMARNNERNKRREPLYVNMQLMRLEGPQTTELERAAMLQLITNGEASNILGGICWASNSKLTANFDQRPVTRNCTRKPSLAECGNGVEVVRVSSMRSTFLDHGWRTMCVLRVSLWHHLAPPRASEHC
jgi:hypothetical protein